MHMTLDQMVGWSGTTADGNWSTGWSEYVYHHHTCPTAVQQQVNLTL